MADTTFVNGVTLTDEDWFNDVNRLHYTIFGDPSTVGAARTNLGAIQNSFGGRLTLASGTPVMTTDQTAKTTVYFTPYNGDVIPIYDGTYMVPTTFTELSQATTDSTKSPAAVAASKNYDVFVWNDSGTIRATRGPTWDSGAVAGSDTSRGTGAGSTELQMVKGVWTNKNAITNGPAANRGTYVGTIRSDGSSQINDSVTLRHVWNNYNRVPRLMRKIDTADSWTYTTASFRQANGSAANQLDFVVGVSEDAVIANAIGISSNDNNAIARVTAIGLDGTTRSSDCINGQTTPAANSYEESHASYAGYPGIGRHYLTWLEYSTATGTTTWLGDSAGTLEQSGIWGEVLS